MEVITLDELEKPKRIKLKQILPVLCDEDLRAINYTTERVLFEGLKSIKRKRYLDWEVYAIYSELRIKKEGICRFTFNTCRSRLTIALLPPEE